MLQKSQLKQSESRASRGWQIHMHKVLLPMMLVCFSPFLCGIRRSLKVKGVGFLLPQNVLTVSVSMLMKPFFPRTAALICV